MVGTRGVPARYGGFETAIEEIGSRLAASGTDVVVYCRHGDTSRRRHLGMELVHLPSVRRRSLDTLSHSFVSVLHLLRWPCDIAIVFNGANAVFVPFLRLRGIPTAVHVDGIEWQRGKWNRAARAWHRLGERMAVRFANEVIADAEGIQDYYARMHGASTTLLTYGAPVLADAGSKRLSALGLQPRGYHLVVARFEPENHIDLMIRGYRQSESSLPLVVVGAASYPTPYDSAIDRARAEDPSVHMLGSIWDQALLGELYANCATYLHGHSVGGTNPSLLRAMGAGAPVLAIDVVFTREVLDDTGEYFADADGLAELLREAEADPAKAHRRGAAGQERACERYCWDDVAAGYRDLCAELAD